MLKTLVITLIPSPYQVELFNWLQDSGAVDCQVAYLQRRLSDRQWAVPPLRHPAHFLEETADPGASLRQWAAAADLVVVSNYSAPFVRTLMAWCVREPKPWCFWGERPGFRQFGALGALYRRWRLRPLHRSGASIWGMGQWAVDGWRAEFGVNRRYFNIPYFSDLDRYRPQAHRPVGARRRFLFSGSLIPRKGIDLLLSAFVRLAAKEPRIELEVLGAGPLESALREQSRGLGDRVRFLGFRDWPDLPRVYHEADVLCVPSRYDGWGLVVPEGLAAGLPTIATDRMGSALELVRSGANGWLIPADQETPLYTAVAEAAALSDAELRQRSEAASASVRDHSLAAGGRRWLAAAHATLENNAST